MDSKIIVGKMVIKLQQWRLCYPRQSLPFNVNKFSANIYAIDINFGGGSKIKIFTNIKKKHLKYIYF